MYKNNQTAEERILDLEGELAVWITRAGQYQLESREMRNAAQLASEELFRSWGGFEKTYDEEYNPVPPMVEHIYNNYSDYSKLEVYYDCSLSELRKQGKITFATYKKD
jgi:hypothetical protein